MASKLSKYINDYIFFNTEKSFKSYVRRRVMDADHKLMFRLLMVIMVMQIGMIVYSLVVKGTDFSLLDAIDKTYFFSYVIFAVSCPIIAAIAESFYKKQMTVPYFVTVSIAVILIFAWGVVISILDSYSLDPNNLRYPNIVTFSYISLAIIAIVVMEPWVFMLDATFFTVFLNLFFYYSPNLKFTNSLLINSISICLLTWIGGIFNFHRRITAISAEKEKAVLSAAMKDKAYFDDLTKINNRRFLTDRIDSSLNAGRYPSGVIMFDIDGFKGVNDTYGHQDGDLILIAFGELINKFFAGKATYCVRYGGDEFLIFFDHTTERELFEYAEKFREIIAKESFKLKDGKEIKLTVSMGSATATTGKTYSALINEADKYLYYSKNHGKNCVTSINNYEEERKK